MAITGEYNLYQYQQPAFGSLTAQGGARAPRSEGYYQAMQGVPNTTPQVVGLGIPTTDDMERASQILESGIGVSSSREAGATSNPYAAKGAGWEGFSVPKNTGNGELPPPVMSGSGVGDKFDSQRWFEEQFQI